MEKASEEDKQKLREGKASITKVYREVVAPEKEAKQEAPAATEALISDARRKQNERELSTILKKLLEKELFCPICGHTMLECSKCHKTLQESLKLHKEDTSSS